MLAVCVWWWRRAVCVCTACVCVCSTTLTVVANKKASKPCIVVGLWPAALSLPLSLSLSLRAEFESGVFCAVASFVCSQHTEVVVVVSIYPQQLEQGTCLIAFSARESLSLAHAAAGGLYRPPSPFPPPSFTHTPQGQSTEPPKAAEAVNLRAASGLDRTFFLFRERFLKQGKKLRSSVVHYSCSALSLCISHVSLFSLF